MSPKWKKFALPSSGKRVSARVSLALVPVLSNYAVFIAIHDAYHGFGCAITAYSYTDRQSYGKLYWPLAIRMTTKNTFEGNILCSLTFEVFQKHTFFSHKTFPTTIAEMSRRQKGSSPKRQRQTVLDRKFPLLSFAEKEYLFCTTVVVLENVTIYQL